jgi:hypothetical protein
MDADFHGERLERPGRPWGAGDAVKGTAISRKGRTGIVFCHPATTGSTPSILSNGFWMIGNSFNSLSNGFWMIRNSSDSLSDGFQMIGNPSDRLSIQFPAPPNNEPRPHHETSIFQETTNGHQGLIFLRDFGGRSGNSCLFVVPPLTSRQVPI